MVSLLRGVTVALLVLAAGGCERDSPSRDGRGTISGNERIGWDQAVGGSEELASLRYILLVDGDGGYIQSVTCGAVTNAGTASCSGSLRPMSPGTHVLEMTAVLPDGTQSARSAPLTVTVGASGALMFDAGAVASGDASPAGSGERSSIRTAAEVAVEMLADGIADATDLAVADDGRVWYVERAGTVRRWSQGNRETESLLVLDDVSTAAGSGLLSIAIDPDYARNHFVYLAYAAGSGFRIARYRESSRGLGERTVLFETAADPAHTTAVLRVGPDGRLYLALDDQGDTVRSGDLGWYGGKLLRLAADGTVPDDQAGYTPVLLPNLTSPRGLDWIPQGSLLWLADGGGDRGMLLAALVGPETPRRAAIVSRVALRRGETVSGLRVYRGEMFGGWQGQLLMGLNPAGQLLRLEVDPASPSQVSASSIVMETDGGPVTAIALDLPGNVYVISGTRLLRLTSAASTASSVSAPTAGPAFLREPAAPPPAR